MNRKAEGRASIVLQDGATLDEVADLYGFETNAIVSMAEVTEYLHNKPCGGRVVIDDTIKAAIDAYYEQYGAK